MWLSATSAGRLLHCPASASLVSAPDPVPASPPGNAGTLAHFAVNAWVEGGAWLSDAPGLSLQDCWDSEAARWGVDTRRLTESVMTRSRLRSRGAELAALLQSVGETARSEVSLRDSAQLLYGQVDIVVNNQDGGAIIDLRTGADSQTERVRTQLLVYAHLFRHETNRLPDALIVFSLRHGAEQIDFSEGDIDGVLKRVQAARKQPSLAFPDPAGCKFCRRRLRCEPHWEAASAWEDPDCVEGVVSRMEAAATSLMAIRVDTISAQQWVTGLASSVVGGLKSGDTVRFTEVAGKGEPLAKEWRATRSTRSARV
ncbi:PD-(D/E)XK nuclease family protein [Frigoribacterium sp. Leaf186]|uniref:PD-(D/E)XK nuclease family protein n=1 Tax=Frigoribacterium sp. Leaf186 TaxID=1736293 RepID=UPI0009E7C0CD|nr:PD-(D/E)XK nuclease family protein [Frigoribacterium sp. Leaf186]